MTREPDLSKIAIYRRLADVLREDIRSGEYKPGDRLPSESDMIARYDTSRDSVRKALNVLATEGLIEIRHGKGSFVADPPSILAINRADLLTWETLPPTVEPEPRRTYAEPDIAGLLEIEPFSQLFVLPGVAVCPAARKPLITRRVVPAATLADITPAPDPYGPRTDLFAALTSHYGPLTARVYERALIPTQDLWEHLGISSTTAALETIRVTSARTRTGERRRLIAEVEITAASVRYSFPVPVIATDA